MTGSDGQSPPSLSVCIPVYNFAEFLPATLDSILGQDGAGEIEVVVLDGGSTDHTPQIMAAFADKFPQIRYVRLPQRGGIDRDMAKAVSLASNDYCWLFSGDDIMIPGAIREILGQIGHLCDVYVLKHFECTSEMVPLTEWPVLKVNTEITFDLSDRYERLKYFSIAANSEALFSFMSGIVVKRAKWESISLNEAFVGSCWAHVARLFELMPAGMVVKYIPRVLLSRRGDNDSFSSRGLVNRYRISIEGYNNLGDTFFGRNSIEAYHIRRALRGDLALSSFVLAKFKCRENPETEDRILLDRLVGKFYQDSGFSGKLEWFLYLICPTFPWLLPLLRRGYRMTGRVGPNRITFRASG